jgi:putative transposase
MNPTSKNHMDYIHFNPVKHGLAQSPRDWPWTSFHRWVKAGAYPEDWASASEPDFKVIAESVGE